MTNQEIINKIAATIKSNRKSVIAFLVDNGSPVKKSDSDVKIGKELSKVLAKSDKANLNRFASIMEGKSNADGTSSAIQGATAGAELGPIGAIGGALVGLFSSAQQSQAQAKQSSDAITLALINAGAQRQKPSNTNTIIAVVLILVVLVIIGVLLYLKFKKK